MFEAKFDSVPRAANLCCRFCEGLAEQLWPVVLEMEFLFPGGPSQIGIVLEAGLHLCAAAADVTFSLPLVIPIAAARDQPRQGTRHETLGRLEGFGGRDGLGTTAQEGVELAHFADG